MIHQLPENSTKRDYGGGRVARRLLFLIVLLSLSGAIMPVALAADNYPPPVGTGDFTGRWQVRSNIGLFDASFGVAAFGDIAFDPEGNMYVQAIRSPFAVIKLSPGGDVLASWGPNGVNNGQFQTTEFGIGISTFTPSPGTTWVYVLDRGNCRVQRFDQHGSFLSSFGSCGNGPNLFVPLFGSSDIGGLEVSPLTGDVYVLESGREGLQPRILQFDMFGNWVRSWNAPFRVVSSVTVDPVTGDVWTVTYFGAVTHFTRDGTFIETLFEDGASCPNPGGGDRQDLVVKSGTVYLATSNRIEKYGSTGSCLLDWGDAHGAPVPGEADNAPGSVLGASLDGITFGPGGHIWLATGSRIIEWTDIGIHVRTILKPDSFASGSEGHFAVDSNRDTIYSTHHFEILRYDLAGHMKGYWTWEGHNRADKCAFFTQIATHPVTGDLYAGCAVGLVRQYSPTGVVIREYGIRCSPCTGVVGEIPTPLGVAVDASGNVYVSSGHPRGNRIVKFDSTGTPVLAWGTTGLGPGEFNFTPPEGEIEIAPDGNLYVFDALGNTVANRVQVFTSAGTFLRAWGPFFDPERPSSALKITSLAFDPAQVSVAYLSASWSPDFVRFGFRIYRVGLDAFALDVVLSNLDGFGGAFGQDIQIGTGGDLYSVETASGSRLSRWAPANTAPTADAGGPYSIGEGGSVILAGSGSDPDQGDLLTFTWDLDGDGTFETGGQTPTFSAAGLDGPASQTVVLKVCDSHGACATDTAVVSVLNISPNITSVTNDSPINEGSTATITVTATDPGGASDPLRYEFDCGNDGLYEVGLQPNNSASCSFGDNGTYQVNVRVTDDEGGTTTGSTIVTVNNVAPTVTVTPNTQTRLTGSLASISVTCQDPGPDTWTASVDWGDGSPVESLGSVACNSLAFGASHTYSVLGSHTVTVRVTDDDGGSGTGTATVQVYDFTVTLLPSDRTVLRGGSTSYDATVSLVPGSSGAPGMVSLSLAGAPLDSTFTLPSLVALPGTATLTVGTGPSSLGDFALIVTGATSDGLRSGSAGLHLYDFTVSLSPSSTTLALGQSGAYSATIGLLTGSSATSLPAIQINLGAPPDPSCSVNDASAIVPSFAGTTRYVTCVSTLTSPAGSHAVSVTGADTRTPEGGSRSGSAALVIVPVSIDRFLTDSDFNTVDVVDTVFTPSCKSCTSLTLVATNPGTYYYNLRLANSGSSSLSFTVTITIPPGKLANGAAVDPAFVLMGAVPIHVYGDGARTVDITSQAIISVSADGKTITLAMTIPQGELRYATVHLDYNLKGTTAWPGNSRTNFRQSYTFQATIQVAGSDAIGNNPAYAAFVGQKITGIGGYVIDTNGNPKVGLKAQLFDSNGNALTCSTCVDYSASDGFYLLQSPDNAAGKFVVRIFDSMGLLKATSTAQNLAQYQFSVVSFALNPADPTIYGFVLDESGRGIGGVTVELYNMKGRLLSRTTTSPSGFYAFSFSAPGTYSIRIVFPGDSVAQSSGTLHLAQFEIRRADFVIRNA